MKRFWRSNAFWTGVSIVLALGSIWLGVEARSDASDAEELSIVNSKIDRASTAQSNCYVVVELGGEVGEFGPGETALAKAREYRDDGQYDEAAKKADEAYETLQEAGCPSAYFPPPSDRDDIQGS